MRGRAGDARLAVERLEEARQYFAEGKEQSIALLQQAIRTLEDDIADQESGGQKWQADIGRTGTKWLGSE